MCLFVKLVYLSDQINFVLFVTLIPSASNLCEFLHLAGKAETGMKPEHIADMDIWYCRYGVWSARYCPDELCGDCRGRAQRHGGPPLQVNKTTVISFLQVARLLLGPIHWNSIQSNVLFESNEGMGWWLVTHKPILPALSPSSLCL